MLQVGSEVGTHLKGSGVEVKDYTALLADIKTLASSHTKLWADPAKVHFSSSSPPYTSSLLFFVFFFFIC